MLKYSFQAFLVLYSIRGVGASRCEAAAGRFCVVNRKGFMLCCCLSSSPSPPPPLFFILPFMASLVSMIFVKKVTS